MAILVVNRVDVTHPDPYIDCQHYKRGDVIQVLPDDHTFSETERKNPNWCFIPVPGVTPDDLRSFEAAEIPNGPSRVLQRRGVKFDIEHPDLPQNVKDIVADDTRSAEADMVLSAPTANAPAVLVPSKNQPMFDALAFRVRKDPVSDPAVIG